MLLSTNEIAQKWGVSVTWVTILCKQGRIPGVVRKGNRWYIPADAERPDDKRKNKNATKNSRFTFIGCALRQVTHHSQNNSTGNPLAQWQSRAQLQKRPGTILQSYELLLICGFAKTDATLPATIESNSDGSSRMEISKAKAVRAGSGRISGGHSGYDLLTSANAIF